jgi:hypothetical protein
MPLPALYATERPGFNGGIDDGSLLSNLPGMPVPGGEGSFRD